MKKSVLSIAMFSMLAASARAETWGNNNDASGSLATAWGANNVASGSAATVWGNSNVASVGYVTAWGVSNDASGSYATVWGVQNDASGSQSTVWGRSNTASGGISTAWGTLTTASGDRATAWGYGTAATARYSTALGSYTIANARNSMAVGTLNVEFSDVDPHVEADTDPLFSIGNGTSLSDRSNAFTVLRDGTTTVNGDVFVYGGVYELSDANLKSYIEPLYFSKGLVMGLNPVTYVMSDDAEQKSQIGFIAQEVEQVLPELVGESIDGYKTLDYAKMTAVLVGAIQTLSNENDRIAEENSRILEENKLLKSAVCKIDRSVKICRSKR